MAVYTVLTVAEIDALLQPCGIGPVIAARGISEGIENSNYAVTAGDGKEYVLTIAEAQSFEDLDFIVRLTGLLQAQGLPVPAPLRTREGRAVFAVRDKPAVLVPKISGEHPLQPTASQCRVVGAALAHFHRITTDSGLVHSGHRGLAWLRATAARVRPQLAPAGQALLNAELANLDFLAEVRPELPQAIIHGDLFRDNTLFEGERLTALIDFFSAGTGFLLFDLAVVANDWCARPDGRLERSCYQRLLDGYREVRPPTAAEQRYWPNLLRLAALRFWVSRLFETATRPETAKDPGQYLHILQLRIAEPEPWPL